jgi:hypothetical protein
MQVLFLLSQSLSQDLRKGYRTRAQELAIKLHVATHWRIEGRRTGQRKFPAKPEKLQKCMTM